MKGKITVLKDNVQSTLSDPMKSDVIKGVDDTQVDDATNLPTPIQLHEDINEKERFIQAMELGMTTRKSTTSNHSNTTTNIINNNNNNSINMNGTTIDDVEQLERIQRQLALKADLEMQMAEQKRRKREEKERERQWEKEQEERLAKEREKLRIEWEAERAAQRAKVTGKDDVQVLVPNKTADKSNNNSSNYDSEVKRSLSSERKKEKETAVLLEDKKSNANNTNRTENEASTLDDCSSNTTNTQPCTITQHPQDTISAQQLADHLQKQLATFIQDKASSALDQKCSQILDSIKQIIETQNCNSSQQSTALPQSIPVIVQPVFLTPENASGIARSLSAPALQQHQYLPYSPSHRLPIVYTTSELKIEETRPNTSYNIRNTNAMSEIRVPAATQIQQQQHQMKGQQSARLSLWKKASKKLRKLTVQKAMSSDDGTWIQEEDSSQSLP